MQPPGAMGSHRGVGQRGRRKAQAAIRVESRESMANPKRRHSVTRKGMRRAHDHLTNPHLGECPRCGSPKRAHQVCLNCGYYRGRDILRLEATDEENKGS